MSMSKDNLLKSVAAQQAHLFDLSCRIFDFNEGNGLEYKSSALCSDELEKLGFSVERGISNQATAFRAVWKNGEGGPNIGILGEYDALVGKGHACGHHLQTTAAIGAVKALQEVFAGSDTPMTLTVYGTPAEETYGGKIIMQEAGCFRELDICLGTHASRVKSFVGGTSMALNSYVVTYHGRSAHAAGSPWLGRSAMDAMLLTFQGLEFMREHVKDGTRMHYSVKEAIGPSNVVPQRACAGFTLRSRDNSYLPELDERFRNVVKGACLMTDTTADFEKKPSYLARKRNDTLAAVAKMNAESLGLPLSEPFVQDSGGSTDFGNVSGIIPGCLIYLPYVDAPSHSDEWVAAGKTDAARRTLLLSTQMLALTVYDLVTDPAIIQKAREEFNKIN